MKLLFILLSVITFFTACTDTSDEINSKTYDYSLDLRGVGTGNLIDSGHQLIITNTQGEVLEIKEVTVPSKVALKLEESEINIYMIANVATYYDDVRSRSETILGVENLTAGKHVISHFNDILNDGISYSNPIVLLTPCFCLEMYLADTNSSHISQDEIKTKLPHLSIDKTQIGIVSASQISIDGRYCSVLQEEDNLSIELYVVPREVMMALDEGNFGAYSNFNFDSTFSTGMMLVRDLNNTPLGIINELDFNNTHERKVINLEALPTPYQVTLTNVQSEYQAYENASVQARINGEEILFTFWPIRGLNKNHITFISQNYRNRAIVYTDTVQDSRIEIPLFSYLKEEEIKDTLGFTWFTSSTQIPELVHVQYTLDYQNAQESFTSGLNVDILRNGENHNLRLDWLEEVLKDKEQYPIFANASNFRPKNLSLKAFFIEDANYSYMIENYKNDYSYNRDLNKTIFIFSN